MTSTPIAIIGMGCRFPEAADVGAYWRNIVEARVCFSEIPGDRWNHALFYDPSPRAIDKTYARKVGLLDDVRSFAALHYGIAPLRASVMDPQHRLLLDSVRVALEDAGYGETALAGSRTGVFVGASVAEYKDLNTSRLRARALFDGQWGRAPAATSEIVDAIVEDVTPLRAFTIAGNLLNMAAATVAQTFDLRGPAFTIDAACSSSLVATFDAMLSLRAGVCDVAIAGGVYLNLTPDNLVGFSRIGAISPSDACRPFDERSDGFVLGEGVGAVVLKRLDDALRDGDRIYAVIRGAGINNDGRGEGPMTPRLEGQLDAIARAHAECDFTPDAVGFVEAHGTATAVGDAIEVGALRRYFVENARGPIDCWLSSVKANIGHTMSAAGIAALIKAALVIERATVPPQAGFDRAHGALELGGSGFRIATAATPFRAVPDAPRRAAVSSFGFGGTNCHLVLEQAPERRRSPAAAGATRQQQTFTISAPTPALLDAYLGALRGAIHDTVPLADIAHTLACRPRFDARVGFVAGNHDELRSRLDAARAAVRSGGLFAEGNVADARLDREDASLVWLPPTPLPTERYWCATRADAPRPALPELRAATSTPLVAEQRPAAPVHPGSADTLERRLLELVAQVGSFPRGQIKPTQRLVDDLGFDSLMLVELGDRACDAFPGLDGLPETLFTRDTTAADVAAYVRGAWAGAPAPVDTEPREDDPPSSAESISEIPREHFAIEAFPEYVALRARIGALDEQGIENPYFNVHECVTNDTAVIKGRELINFSTYNYLGLSGEPAVSRAAVAAISSYGTSVSASRIASGEKPLHRDLETAIAEFLGCDDAIVMVGGHATNVSVIGHLLGPGDLVLHDSLAHDSILGGIAQSGARRRPFPHNDWRALDEALGEVRHSFRRVLIAIEGVYSMDGDIPDLPRFIEVKQRHKALLLVDEAHSLGVVGARGAGIGELYGVARSDVELWMGTLSKSLASCGGYIAGSHALVQYLKYTTPGFVYSVGLSPPNAAAALAALRELRERPGLVAAVQERARLFLALCRERGLDTGASSGSAVVPCIIGDSARCMRIASALADAGINVQPIVYPAVEEHLARLRFFITARHTDAQLRRTADTLATVLAAFT